MIFLVDLSPRVDRDFFSSDDPQLQQDERIRELFPDRLQVIVAAAGDIYSLEYARRLGLSVVLGTAAAVALVLLVFPWLAAMATRRGSAEGTAG